MADDSFLGGRSVIKRWERESLRKNYEGGNNRRDE